MDTNQQPEQSAPSAGNQGQKKALLEKLMSNLLNKPGRSMHEIINGVKEAIGAYKNYAKEWDTLNGIVAPTGGASTGGALMGPVPAAPEAPGKNSIQTILDQIKQQKTGSVPMNAMSPIPPMPPKPEMMPMPQMKPAMPPMPPQGQMPSGAGGPGLIAGPPQTSTFNRPAPVSNLGIHGF
jgi:hypothetical protein